MLFRLSNVIFYFCYAAALFFIAAGIITFEGIGIAIGFGLAMCSFCFGWAIRYVLTGEKAVWAPKFVKDGAQTAGRTLLKFKQHCTTPEFRSKAKENSLKYAKNTAIVVVALVAFTVVKVAIKEGSREYQIKSALQRIEDDPKFNAFMSGFKKYFPDEYKEFLGKAEYAMRHKHTVTKARETGFEYMRNFVSQNKSYIRFSSDETIQQIIIHSSALTEQMQKEDAKMCADFAMRGLSPSVQMPDAITATMMDVSLYIITAIHEGKNTPRVRKDISDQHFIKIIEELKAQGMPDAYIDAIFAGTTASLPVKEECALGVAFYKAAEALPKQTTGDLFSYILSVSDSTAH